MLGVKKNSKPRVAMARNPERTRRNLLQAAFEEIHKNGFRGTDLESILDRAGVTKGALYHYFESKEDLGYAVLDEVIAEIGREKWLLPLQKAESPIDVLTEIFLGSSTKPEHIRGGCPVNNLVLEMSPLHEGFRLRLAKQFDAWRGAIAGALNRGQQKGLVRKDLDPDETAMFLMATYEGFISLAKNSQEAETMQSGMRTIAKYLETLRVKDL
jgi:TetR/AcrR family transcriptional regulator, transcriptional repressor for nem operon